MNERIQKPPDSPNGDLERWQQEWKAYVEMTWKNVEQETRKAFEESDPKDTEVPPREKPAGHGEEKCDGANFKAHQNAESYEVEGELQQLAPEGRRVMVCIGYKIQPTRFGPKDYLYWRDEETGLVLPQYFRHYEKYPVGSKAVKTFIAALGARPKRIDRMSLRKLVGLRAKVFVETVRPAYDRGAIKGEPMAESLSYSKVSQLLEPLDRVDLPTLN